MSNNPIISIVIPAYNIGQYLGRALDSIVVQDPSDGAVEIIVIDDCSTDCTWAVAKSYQKQSKLITAVHLDQNRGVSNARNVGINIAKGEYIWFVDGDDAIAPGSIRLLKECISQLKEPDIIAIGYQIFGDTPCDIFTKAKQKNKTLDVRSSLQIVDAKSFRTAFYRHAGSLISWNAIYKRSVVGDLPFRHYRNGEDVLFGVESLLSAKSIATIGNLCYAYCIRENSACRTFNKAQLDSSLRVVGEIIDLVSKFKWYGAVKDILVNKINIMLCSVPYESVERLGVYGYSLWVMHAREIYLKRHIINGWRYGLVKCILHTNNYWLIWVAFFLPMRIKSVLLKNTFVSRLNDLKNRLKT